jgi:hypothetical protein
MFPLFYQSSAHSLRPTRVSHTCTWLCRVGHPSDQRRWCFGQLSHSLPCCPSSCAALTCFRIPQQTMIPSIKSFDHSVNIILAHASAKFHGYRIKYERDMFLSCPRCPCCPAAALRPVGMLVPDDSPLRRSCPSIIVYIIYLHTSLQVFLVI